MRISYTCHLCIFGVWWSLFPAALGFLGALGTCEVAEGEYHLVGKDCAHLVTGGWGFGGFGGGLFWGLLGFLFGFGFGLVFWWKFLVWRISQLCLL